MAMSPPGRRANVTAPPFPRSPSTAASVPAFAPASLSASPPAVARRSCLAALPPLGATALPV
eukprot:6114732-Pleurochrysis_carterae.AAC.2